jgi:hypothetical protein
MKIGCRFDEDEAAPAQLRQLLAERGILRSFLIKP